MATSSSTNDLDFLKGEPEPVQPGTTPSEDTSVRLPQDVIDRLMQLRGVDGVWIERRADGSSIVVLHYTPKGPAPHLPKQVEGMPTRIIGGEPIRAF